MNDWSAMKTVYQEADPQLRINTTVHQDDGKTVIQKTWDAEPHLLYAKGLREATEGKNWGEGRVIGTVPDAVMGMFIRQDGKLDAKRCAAWLKENPAFICFEKFR